MWVKLLLNVSFGSVSWWLHATPQLSVIVQYMCIACHKNIVRKIFSSHISRYLSCNLISEKNLKVPLIINHYYWQLTCFASDKLRQYLTLLSGSAVSSLSLENRTELKMIKLMVMMQSNEQIATKYWERGYLTECLDECRVCRRCCTSTITLVNLLTSSSTCQLIALHCFFQFSHR